MEINRSEGLSGPGRVEGPRLNPAGAQDLSFTPAAGDRVEISDMARLTSAVARVPDVRAEKIRNLREAIARGDYETDEKYQVAVERFLEEIGAA